jgi:hypothetical protein
MGEKKAVESEIDQMLDTALGGQSKKLISIAEGQGTASPAAPGAAAAAKPGEDLLQGLSRDGIAIPSLEDEGAGEEESHLPPGSPEPKSPLKTVAPAPLQEYEEGRGEAAGDVLSLTGGEGGADDLLTALRLEAMKEKKKDDTSLIRDLRGMKVTGKQLLDELDSLVREMRGR